MVRRVCLRRLRYLLRCMLPWEARVFVCLTQAVALDRKSRGTCPNIPGFDDNTEASSMAWKEYYRIYIGENGWFDLFKIQKIVK